MGRRSINTTKSGKYMNPTDQARKEARKKELKKNKRQRQLVRAAVLKNKDPGQILEEMEKIDEMEYNVLQPSPLNEKVLKDKRKKLKETFDRVMRLYQSEEPEHWSELKRKEVDYEKKRLKKQQYYESVKHAQSVQIDEIPLPSAIPTIPSSTTTVFPGTNRLPPPPSSLSLPPFAPGAPPGTLKKPTESKPKSTDNVSTRTVANKKIDLLGVPLGPSPNLNDMKDLDTDAEEDEVILKEYRPILYKNKTTPKTPNSLQQRMLAISGQNIDEFMKEMEHVHKKKEKERKAVGSGTKESVDDSDSNQHSDRDSHHGKHSSDLESDDSDNSQSYKSKRIGDSVVEAHPTIDTAPIPIPLPPAIHTPHLNIPAPPMPPTVGIAPPMLFRPPIRPHAFGIRPNIPRMGIRMPPGPPPGLPPRMMHNKHLAQQVIDNSKGVTIITAKPQIRNLSADVTRFVPSTLRVKREETRKPNRTKPFLQEPTSNYSALEANKAATKDDAYMQFMNEMQGLL